MHRINRLYRKRKTSPEIIVDLGGREVVLHNDVYLTLGIGEGDYVSDEQLAQWEGKDAKARCRRKAWDALSARPRSTAELQKTLLRRFSPAVVQQVLKELTEQKHLNDEQFTALYAEQLDRKGSGPRVIAQKLKQKGLPEPLIEQAVSQVQEKQRETDRPAELLAVWIRKQRPATTREEQFKLKSRAMQFLARKGFEFDSIRQAVEAGLGELETDESGFYE